MLVALAGGVGGARLAEGLAGVCTPDRIAFAVNTGDDFEHLGLHVSPDLDTVVYTLAGLVNRANGWGRAEETWSFMSALRALGGETWFQLGDRDLATHVERTRRLRAGETLSAIMASLAARLGVAHPILPMSDDPVRTVVHTDTGRHAFQEYFVKLRCAPHLASVAFEGAATARLSPGLARLLGDPALEAIILCPSNPYLSIAPFFALAELERWWGARRVPVVAVSPIVGGRAIKGPAAKIMGELGVEVSVRGVVAHYGDRVDAWVIDREDRALAPDIEALGKPVIVTDTVMRTPDLARALAREIVAWIPGLARRSSA